MTRPEARSFINIVLLQFREDLVSWLSFATLLTWMFGMYWSDTFANDPSGAQFGILHLRALWLATHAVALLVMLAASRPLLRPLRATLSVVGTLLRFRQWKQPLRIGFPLQRLFPGTNQ